MNEYMCPNCVTPWKCNGPHIPEPYDVKDYWRDRLESQGVMEKTTPWAYCPWCGNRLTITPSAHLCGYPDID
jgi:hypothetical protein